MLTLFLTVRSQFVFSAMQNSINENDKAGIGGDYNTGLFGKEQAKRITLINK